ncbi:LysR family transcriptional regulator [Aliamphritea spongicola]|uniref:LysR family transcriptional regulator n=1 Tax=Aliamphritea spongicola TaxID=707589 RepID=UPI00196B7C43|nr:LysR family transcriptional regulator [Aliamphritea spongicola]MBN3563074.1 LysR family transcriptional regulator [Aliamphritea spongicola]
MREVNLRSIDLNLLVVLLALLETRHVTRAADRLHMSQPAVSRALQRLRGTFDDELLVRTTAGYDLSARAVSLLPKLQTLLDDTAQLIAEPEFIPAQARDVVRFYGLDLEACCFLPSLMKVLQEEAPQMRLEMRSDPRNHFDLLEEGDVHFTITALSPSRSESQYRRLLMAQTHTVCLMGEHHPLVNQELTLEKYLAASHGIVSVTGQGMGIIDERLETLGKSRHLGLRLSNFMSVADFCETTDLLFVLPELIAKRIVDGRRVIYREVPAPLHSANINFYLYWHERYHRDPMCIWVRQQLMQSLQH